MRALITGITATVVTLLGLAYPVASLGGSFTVTPPKTQVDVDAGQSTTGTLRIFTEGAGERYEVTVGDAKQTNEGGYIFSDPKGSPEAVSSWLKVSPKTFISGPGAVEPITWTMTVPESIGPGDYLGAFYVTQIAEPKKGQVTVQARIAVRLEVRVRGDVTFQPVLRRIEVPKVISGGDVPIEVTLANKGNVQVNLREADTQRVVITSGGKRVKSFSFVPKDPTLPVVLHPGAVRTFKFKWTKPPTFGRLETRVDIRFDNENVRLRGSRPFNIVPYREVGGGAIAAAGLLLILGYFVVRSLKRRRRRGK